MPTQRKRANDSSIRRRPLRFRRLSVEPLEERCLLAVLNELAAAVLEDLTALGQFAISAAIGKDQTSYLDSATLVL